MQAVVAASRGDVDAARTFGQRSLRLQELTGHVGAHIHGLALLELSLENYEAAYELVLPALERMAKRGARFPTMKTPIAIEALAHLGRTAEAFDRLERFEKEARGADRAWALASVQHCRGVLAAADDDLQEAERAAGCRRRTLSRARPSLRARPLAARARNRQAAPATETGGAGDARRSAARASTVSEHASGSRAPKPSCGGSADGAIPRDPRCPRWSRKSPRSSAAATRTAKSPWRCRSAARPSSGTCRRSIASSRPLAYRARDAPARVNPGIPPGDPRAAGGLASPAWRCSSSSGICRVRPTGNCAKRQTSCRRRHET